MKLFSSTFFAIASATWEQPKYKDFLRALETKSPENWGAPVGKASAFWSLCPALNVPENGSVVCNQSTCALVCDPGFVGIGRRRTKCRWNSWKGFHFKRQLGECGSCPTLTSPPRGTFVKCFLNWVGKQKCVFKCDDEPSSIFDGTMFRAGVSVVCKCPRSNNRICGWYDSRKINTIITDEEIATFVCPTTTTTSTTTTTTMTTTTTTTTTTEKYESGPNSLPSGLSCPNPAAPISRSDRIIGGTQVNRESTWPWLVKLPNCGGSIISKNPVGQNDWILTAAHCTMPVGRYDGEKILVGSENIEEDGAEASEFTVNILEVHCHPEWCGGDDRPPGLDSRACAEIFDMSLDFCLLEVENLSAATPSGCNNCWEPACLPAQDEHVADGTRCYAAGWGTTVYSEDGSNYVFPEHLLNIPLHALHSDDCRPFPGVTDLLSSDMFCAGNYDGGVYDDSGTTCNGDSGGPLICEQNGMPVLYGVASWGMQQCTATGVFAKVAALSDWIYDTASISSVTTTQAPTAPPTDPPTDPPTEPPTDSPATANPGDAACLALSGTCTDFRFLTCTAGYTTGNCAGDFNRKCCMPCDATCEATEASDSVGDSACDGVFGICKHNTNFCAGSYLVGFCGGGAARQCCQP